MKSINVAEAKARLSSLIDAAMNGEEIIIAKRGVPLVTLRPVERMAGGRRLGSAKGHVHMSEDFDDTPDEFAEYL
jgi:prevent-host-death family protein